MRRLRLEVIKKTPLTVKIPDEITVGELASRMKKTAAEVIKTLLKNGVMATVNQTIDFDTAEFVAVELGCKVEREVVVTIEERLIDDHQDTEDELVPRSRSSSSWVTSTTARQRCWTRCGTPTSPPAKRAASRSTSALTLSKSTTTPSPSWIRRATLHLPKCVPAAPMCTDIAILVVAADDGVMPQTIEAINHAKAANIPIIVAVNKMDKHGANAEKHQAGAHEIRPHPRGLGRRHHRLPDLCQDGHGHRSAARDGHPDRRDEELKANPNRAAKGTVIEARLDKNRGPIATLLVQNGTLHGGDVIIAGTAVGRVRVMTNDKGRAIQSAGPSIPVEITGLYRSARAGR